MVCFFVRRFNSKVMLRITVVESSESTVTLRVEGRITGSAVEELRTACEVHTSADEVQLSLELADVSFADAAGILLLKELGSRGVGLIRANPFMAEQLKEGHHLTESRVAK
jgi:ABC-type transporter Mla MlaB component